MSGLFRYVGVNSSEWNYVSEYGTPDAVLTPEQAARAKAEREQAEATLARWNAIGQYIQVEGFCFPFSFQECSSALGRSGYGALAYWFVSVIWTDIPEALARYETIYRPVSAAENAPWSKERPR